MSLLNKAIAAISPPESEEARTEARARARAAATAGGWLALVLRHHEQIEAAFAVVKSASTASARVAAQKRLAIILTGHSMAEESVLYPAVALVADEKGDSGTAYTQQSAAKVEMAALDDLDPVSQDYLDKLEHIRGAVAHHVYEEEGTWFLDLQEKASPQVKAKLTRRYQEEFDRYVGKVG